MKIVLASASPRRRELLQMLGLEDFLICPAKGEELPPDHATPEETVCSLASAKAREVAAKFSPDTLIIAADTIVVYEGQIIGKPRGEEEAFRILSMLRNQRHQVITGVCLIDSAADPAEKRCLYDVTDVYFSDYSDEELRAYVQTPEPYDKAGGYAIQESFGKYIDHIEGDMDNVIGFPMYRVEDLLR